MAFAGALLATAVVHRLGHDGDRTQIGLMLLAGIAVNAVVGAAIGLLSQISTDAQVRNLLFWSFGSLGGASWRTLAIAAPLVLVSVALLVRLAPALNALLLGEAEAGHLGIAVERTQRIAVIASALAVGASVSVAGLIGFVGLVVPHMLRLALGPDHKLLLPGSALLGAMLLVIADLVARAGGRAGRAADRHRHRADRRAVLPVAAAPRARARRARVIALTDVHVALGGRAVLRGVSLGLRAGEVLALVGPNGAGKSTLLRVASGERTPDAGQVEVNGRPLRSMHPAHWSRRRAVLPQRSSLAFPFTVGEVVGSAARRTTRTPAPPTTRARWRGRCARPASKRWPSAATRSSRAASSSACSSRASWRQLDPGHDEREPRLLFLDEPVARLDPAYQHGLLSLARRVAQRGIGVLAVLHDLNLAAQYADRIAVLQHGVVRAKGTPTEVLTRELVAEAFDLDVRVVPHPCFDCPLLVTEARAHAREGDRLLPV